MEARQGRDRVSNQRDAKQALITRLDEMSWATSQGRLGAVRKTMIGSGQRGDKIRTIRMQADEAVDHRTGKRIRASDYLDGLMDRLW